MVADHGVVHSAFGVRVRQRSALRVALLDRDRPHEMRDEFRTGSELYSGRVVAGAAR